MKKTRIIIATVLSAAIMCSSAVATSVQAAEVTKQEISGGPSGDYICDDFEYLIRDGQAEITDYVGDLTEVTIPETLDGYDVTRIAVIYSTTIKSLTIPESVTYLGYLSENIENIVIPDSVVEIAMDALDSTKWYENQPNGMVYAGKVAYKYKGDMPENTTLSLKEDTVGIAGGAFKNCINLIDIIIPENVKHIGVDSFYNCTGLTEIEIPSSVEEINTEAFCECKNLQSVKLSEGLKEIGFKSFVSCQSLKSVFIPSSVEIIGPSFGFNYYEDKGYVMDEDFVIYGYANTEAERYASDQGCEFVALKDLSKDINNDGNVDVKDVTTLQKYLASYNVEVNESALDVNGDGIVDVSDVTTMQRILAGYKI